MGVQCTVFGHVYDGTEFEEHRQERPRGEVLICREYQVCGRCGNRTEMYRNERLLTPRDPEQEGTQGDESAGVPDSTLEDAGGGGGDGREGGTETPPEAGVASADGHPTDGSPTAAPPTDDTPTDDAIDAQRRSDDRPAGTAGDRFSADGTPDTDPQTEAPPADAPPTGGSSADTPPTDDAVILSDGAADPDATVTGADRGGTWTAELKEEPASDADSDADPTPLFDHDIDDGEVGCRACGRVWDRGMTSLRDGDICPECRRGYVERR